ncbi:MAG: hypothetical protein DRJ10_19600 [Bacteroidetes bacterium]|nr:MAG: hypothetical protein DRJ10_19600 [Bacteroidota bacterium]
MKPFVVILGIFILSSTSCKPKQNTTNEHQVNQRFKTMKGKIVKVDFVNKGGRKIPDVFDYFFEINGEKLFIKITEGKVSRDEIANYLNKEVKIKGFKSNGLWDTDDPNVQSRIGDYVVIMEFLDP